MIREGKTPKEPMREIAQLLKQPSCQGADIASFAQSLFIELADLVGRGMWDIKEVLHRDDARERVERARSKVSKKRRALKKLRRKKNEQALHSRPSKKSGRGRNELRNEF
jgi:hypothetical protein